MDCSNTPIDDPDAVSINRALSVFLYVVARAIAEGEKTGDPATLDYWLRAGKLSAADVPLLEGYPFQLLSMLLNELSAGLQEYRPFVHLPADEQLALSLRRYLSQAPGDFLSRDN